MSNINGRADAILASIAALKRFNVVENKDDDEYREWVEGILDSAAAVLRQIGSKP